MSTPLVDSALDSDPAAVRIRGLTAGYQGCPAVTGIDVDVEPGEVVILFGPSGCGKSTILRAVAGLLAPIAGTIEIDGIPIEGTSAERALVFQEDALLPWRSAQANVELALALRGVPRARRRTEASVLIERVGLAGFARHLPRQLSGGMRQRVQLARTLASRPRVMLMDEPFGALDAQTRASMQALVLEVWSQYRTSVLFVTHDVNEAVLLGDRICVLTSRPARLSAVVDVAKDADASAAVEQIELALAAARAIEPSQSTSSSVGS